MRKRYFLYMLATGILFLGCRTQKTGCPTPKRNLGAERVLEEMSQPKKKKGLFRRN